MAAAVTAEAPPTRARALDFNERMVYHSPEETGHCAWVQLWREPGGGLRLALQESRTPEQGRQRNPIDIDAWEVGGMPATYDFSGLISETVFLRSVDQAASWTEIGRGSCPLAPVSLPDGRLLGLRWASGYPSNATGGGLLASTDAGKTWQRLHEIMDDDSHITYGFSMRLLRDNETLVVFCPYAPTYGPGKEFPVRNATRPGVKNSIQSAVFWSRDFGRTFVGPIGIYPGQPVTESDFCELPSGDLLFLHHRMYSGKCHRQFLKRTALGFVPEMMEEVAANAPEIFVRTNEGYLVGASRNGPYLWSDDNGMNWYPVEGARDCGYQPRAVLMDDGRVLFCWHKGADLAYGEQDMWIGQHTFRLQVENPRAATQLRLARVKDEAQERYTCAFTALLTTADGTPVPGQPVQFSVVGRWEPGYEDFGGSKPWVEGKVTLATTNRDGVARVDYPEQNEVTDIHKSFQICARFNPDGDIAGYLPATSTVWEYYAVTPRREE